MGRPRRNPAGAGTHRYVFVDTGVIILWHKERARMQRQGPLPLGETHREAEDRIHAFHLMDRLMAEPNRPIFISAITATELRAAGDAPLELENGDRFEVVPFCQGCGEFLSKEWGPSKIAWTTPTQPAASRGRPIKGYWTRDAMIAATALCRFRHSPGEAVLVAIDDDFEAFAGKASLGLRDAPVRIVRPLDVSDLEPLLALEAMGQVAKAGPSA